MNHRPVRAGLVGTVALALVFSAFAFLGGDPAGARGAAPDAPSAQDHVLVVGSATANTPVYGARVRLLDADGGAITKASDRITTDRHGMFAVPVDRLPAAFRVTVSGGEVGGRPFRGTLAARAEAAADATPVTVNLVTTLADRYQSDRHTSTRRADAAIAKYLGLPVATRPGQLLEAPQSWFDANRFMSAAGTAGGFDRFVGSVALAASRHPKAVTRFVGTAAAPIATTTAMATAVPGDANPTDSVAAAIAKYVGGKLVDGAISYAGGAAFGWVLDKLGILRSSASEFAEIQAQLAVIQQQLTLISGQIDALMALVGRTNLDVLVQGLMPALDQIGAVQDLMNKLLSLDQKSNDYDILAKDLTEKILKRTESQLLPAWDSADSRFPFGVTLPNGFFGLGGSTPIPKVVYENVARARFFTPARNAAVQQLLGFYALAYATQFQMVLEWEHANGKTSKNLDFSVGAYTDWQKQYDTNQYTSTCALPSGTTLDTKTGVMWSTAAVPGEVPGRAYLNADKNAGPGHVLPATVPPDLPPGTPWPTQFNTGCDAQKDLGSWRVASSDQVQEVMADRPSTTSVEDWMNSTAGFQNVMVPQATRLMTATHGDECTPCYTSDWPYPTESYRTMSGTTGSWSWCMPSWKDYGDDHRRLISKSWLGCWYPGVAWLAARPLGPGEHYL